MPLRALGIHNTGVSDLSALEGTPLLSLTLEGSAVTDLAPLRGLPLERITGDFRASRGAPILRAIPALKTINGKPAAQFWEDTGQVDRDPADASSRERSGVRRTGPGRPS